MLRTLITNIRLTGVALLAGVVLTACQAADGTTQAPDTALVSGIMRGLGAVDPSEKPIEYKPRASLAMPASTDKLPEPEEQVAGSQQPDWPQNARNQDLERVQAIYDRGNADDGDRLTPEQMRGISISSNRPRDRAAEAREQELQSGEKMTVQELKALSGTSLKGTPAEASAAQMQALSQRRYLIDPPSEYSVPSADAPVPVAVETKKNLNRDDFDGALLDMRCAEETGGECRRGN